MRCVLRASWASRARGFVPRRTARANSDAPRQNASNARLSVQHILTREAVDSTVSVTGWIRSARVQKAYSFVEVTDGSCAANLQVMWPTERADSVVTGDKKALTTGASVQIRGKLVASPKPGQRVEVAADSIAVLGPADAVQYPLQKKGHTPEFLRDIVHLRARGALGAAVLRVRDTAARAAQAYLAQQGCLWVHTPILTSNDCEGAGELFQVLPASELAEERQRRDTAAAGTAAASSAATAAPAAAPAATSSSFFPRPTYLTVSGQLHAEAFATAVSRVYTFGPTFRAENSNTPRHLAEFWMLEPEIAPGSMADAMDLAEGCVRACLAGLLEERGDDMAFFAARVDRDAADRCKALATAPAAFARMSYTQAVEILQRSGHTFKFPVRWGEGLASEHERWLAEVHVKGPVFVTDYPAAIKPFYMRASDDGGDGGGGGGARAPGPTVQAFDLLVPRIGELIGGSAREERFHQLATRMRDLNLLSPAVAAAVHAGAVGGPANPDNGTLDWYLDTRRYGTLPHAGWGMGFERLLLLATGLDNIRDVIPVPRVPGSCRM